MYEHSAHTDGPTRAPSLRAGDADREATGERLRVHHAEGRLDAEEFQERIDRCHQAKTVGELEQLVTDLPGSPRPSPSRVRRLWPIPLAPILIAVLLISATRGHHGHSGLWVLIPLFFLVRFRVWGRYRRWGVPGRHEHEI